MIEEDMFLNLVPPTGLHTRWSNERIEKILSRIFPVYVHLSLYRALKLTSLWDIGGLALEETIKSKMEQAVGVLTPAMFNAED